MLSIRWTIPYEVINQLNPENDTNNPFKSRKLIPGNEGEFPLNSENEINNPFKSRKWEEKNTLNTENEMKNSLKYRKWDE